jgi:TonB-dependent SusC/RagA subfamily outer membrane receptor
MTCTVRWRLSVLAGAAALLPATLIAQATSTITGRVSDAASGQPIPAAQVNVVGTNLGAVTNEQGRYSIRGAPARQVSVRVLRVGYTEQVQGVAVPATGGATLDFALRQVSVSLTPVVTTATGQTRRVEVGHAVSTLNAREITEVAPIRSVTDVLQARTPGVTVTSGGFVGSGAKVRIRGTTSLSLSNDPIYIIDGVRMTGTSGSSSIGIGGSSPGRAQDINPDEIESIEVVKGPSAATLYGTAAANGVIVITTKRGRAGRTQTTAYVEQGVIQDRNDYPLNYSLVGTRAGQAEQACSLAQVAAGTCTNTTLRTNDLMGDAETTPLALGRRQQYGFNVSGGSEAVRFFTSAEYEGETGPLETPGFARRTFAAQDIAIRGTELNPNALNRMSFRANLNAQPWSKLDFAVSTNYINLNQRLPQADDNLTGIYFNAIGGPGVRNNVNAFGDSLYGYRLYSPGRIFQAYTGQQINRLIGSTTTSWRPTTWLSSNADFGIDLTGRTDADLCRRGTCAQFSTIPQGYANQNRGYLRNITANLGSTASFTPFATLTSKTSVGAQYVNDRFENNYAGSSVLPPGASTVTAGANKFASEATTISKTLGFFVQESWPGGDRLFVTGALRTDQNSAFGTDFQRVVYPKASLSWIVSEEGFFPRAGLGRPVPPALLVRLLGPAAGRQRRPPLLRAEHVQHRRDRSADAAVQRPRQHGAEARARHRVRGRLRDADVRQPPERRDDLLQQDHGGRADLADHPADGRLGRDEPARQHRLGQERRLRGADHAQLVQRRAFGWDVTFNGSTLANKLVSLGGQPPVIGTTISQKAGYPLFGYWSRAVTGWEDRDGNGILSYSADAARNEVMVGDTNVFLGYSTPRHELSFTNGFGFFNGALRVQTLFDYKGGHKKLNNTERFRCDNHANCRGRNDASAPLFEQAANIARTAHPSQTWAGYIEDASFVRFRELAATIRVPERLTARAVGARNVSINAAARNLGTIWDRWTGHRPGDQLQHLWRGAGGLLHHGDAVVLHRPRQRRLLTHGQDRTADETSPDHRRARHAPRAARAGRRARDRRV